MSDSEDDSILDNLQKTRELWTTKADSASLDYLIPKSPVCSTKPVKSPPPPTQNHINGDHTEEDVIRFEDQVEEDFDLPDVKSLKSQWEKAGPAPTPQKKVPVKQLSYTNVYQNSSDLVPVNREPEQPKEEYEVELGKLRERFEREAKREQARRRSYKMKNMCAKFEGKKYTSKLTFRLAASNSKVVWSDGARSNVSKAAVDSHVNKKKKHGSVTKAQTSKTSSNERFEAEIEAQKTYHSSKENIDVPVVELSSIKQQFEQRRDERVVTPYTPNKRKPRETSFSSDSSAPADIVRYDDPPEEEIKYEIELGSIRKKFEQSSNRSQQEPVRSYSSSIQKKQASPIQNHHAQAESESENIAGGDVVKSSEAKYDEMIGEESVKERLARYKAITEQSRANTSSRKIALKPKQRKSTSEVVVVTRTEESELSENPDIVRSPPAGTKEIPDYTASIGLQEAREVFNRPSSRSSQRSRSSRSSSGSPQRRSPRSHSTPSPTNRKSTSSVSSKSPSPVRELKRSSLSSSQSSLSSGRGSPHPQNKSKKVGDPDVVVLEHTEVNFYYEEGKRFNTKIQGPDDIKEQENNMSNADVVRPQPAGTKEEAEFVPSVNLHSVRDMFNNPQDDEPVRGRAPPPKKTIIIESPGHRSDSSDNNSPERNPDVVRSTTAGTREEPVYEISVDLKAARSKFESPQRPDNYVPRNTIQKREEEARRRRAEAAAASPRSSESSDTSGYEVIKTTEAGYREKPEYQVDLKATKHLFEGGSVPTPLKRESSSTRKQHVEVTGDVVRPEPAGTREIVEIKVSNDVKTVKQKFEHASDEVTQQERKEPIDIQQEARMVVHKDKEIQEEVEKNKEEAAKAMSSSASETTSEGEAILDQEVSYDSREVVSDDKQDPQSSSDSEEEKKEAPAAAVPVRVAITEDLNAPEVQEVGEPEVKQEYETYSKVIDYNEDIQPQQEQSTSDSDSEKEAAVEQNHVESAAVETEKIQEQEISMKEEQQEAEEMNHVAASPASDQRSNSGSSSEDQEVSQEGPSLSSSSTLEKGGVGSSGENPTLIEGTDMFANLEEPKLDQFFDDQNVTPSQSVSPPDVSVQLMGAGDAGEFTGDPFDILMTNEPEPTSAKAENLLIADVKHQHSSLLDTSEEDDYDKPHFNYPYGEEESKSLPIANQSPIVTPANFNGGDTMDIFGGAGDALIPTKSPDKTDSLGEDLFGSAPATQTSGDLLADIDTVFAKPTSEQPQQAAASSDPFDLFASNPFDSQPSSTTKKDPFDLFA